LNGRSESEGADADADVAGGGKRVARERRKLFAALPPRGERCSWREALVGRGEIEFAYSAFGRWRGGAASASVIARRAVRCDPSRAPAHRLGAVDSGWLDPPAARCVCRFVPSCVPLCGVPTWHGQPVGPTL
jgi:hypothetical protein